MTREIKFRAWDTKRKKMYRSHCVDEDGNFCVDIDYTNDLECRDDEKIIQMQFIGLKDKNEKEIYEGDIVKNIKKHNIMIGEEISVGVVVFDKGCFKIKYKDIKDPYHFYQYDFRDKKMFKSNDYNVQEVIGNIYENPELLEEINK